MNLDFGLWLSQQLSSCLNLAKLFARSKTIKNLNKCKRRFVKYFRPNFDSFFSTDLNMKIKVNGFYTYFTI